MAINMQPEKFKLKNGFTIEHFFSSNNFHINDNENAYNIVCVKEKGGLYKVDLNTFESKGYTIFFLTPGQRFSSLSDSKSDFYKMSFTTDFHCIEKHNSEIACNGILFNNQEEASFLELTTEQNTVFEMIINNIVNEFQNKGVAQDDMILSYFRMFLVEATRIKMGQKSVKEKDLSEDARIISQFNRLVEIHFKKLHNVSDYAEMIGISPKSISKRFNEAGKEKPSDIIKNRLVLEVKRELLYTDLSIKEIAYSIGFEDPAYFSRFFKKHVGKTPLEFKKSA